LIGQTLNHFRIESKLGEGGMGVVYRATDEKLRREVALKVLPESLAADPERRRRFLREARSAAAVTHNNIATVYEIGESEGHVFIAMELVKGETLRARMEPGLTHAEALRIAKEVARGLACAHESGIVHRDLKPENVMITPAGDVKILDFGLAKVVDREPALDATGDTASQMTAEGRVMGTPPYMSPEQVEGRAEVDARSDVFSFGSMLYEMLSGVMPFQGTTSIGVLYAVVHKEPDALEVVCPDAPAVVIAVVGRCLKKVRDERFASGREVLVALEGEGAAVVTASSSGRAAPATRVSTVSGLGTALGATMAAGAGERVTGAPGVAGPPAMRGRRGFVWLGVAVLAGLTTVVAGSAVRPQHVELAPAASTSTVPLAVPHATTLADLSLPASNVPQALTEYKMGLQLQRDDSFRNALRHFEKAAELDPAMAQAHLRVAIMGENFGGEERLRTEFAKAAQLRGQLSERDRVMLDAVEPFVGRAVPDEALGVARLRAAHERFPRDAELVTLLAEHSIDDLGTGTSIARAATELDPLDGAAWEALGRSLAIAGDLVGGRVALERCAATSSESYDCYFWLAALDGADGRCADMERDASREADGDGGGYDTLAQAVAALGRPEATVRELLARAVTADSADLRPVNQALDDARLAALTGRFDLSLARLDEADQAMTASSSPRRELSTYGPVVALRVALLTEIGASVRARSTAREFSDRLELLTHGTHAGSGDVGPYWWIVRAAGVPLDPRRRDWAELQRKVGRHKAGTWLNGQASPATTPDEARAALADDAGVALPRGGELLNGMVDGSAATGRVYLLAGKPKDALPYLHRAANNCFVLIEPFEHVHAILDLGAALEQTHDAPGACDAYGKVVAQWGHATPRSVTADAAREGMKRLHCAT